MANCIGVDISHHNSTFSFKTLRQNGVQWAILRAGYGKGNADRKFDQHMTAAIASGLPIGIYWYSYSYTVDMARAEADYCAAALEPYRAHITLPVYFDFEGCSESNSSLVYLKKHGVKPTKKLITAMNAAFCAQIIKHGYKAGIYCNDDYCANWLTTDLLNAYPMWYAQYSGKCKHPECGIWQYTSKRRFDGVSGKFDANYLYDSALLPSPHAPTATLRRGYRGSDVKWTQQMLTKAGCPLAADGIFGVKTEAAVKTFQRSHGLTVDGLFGPKSLACILTL